MATKIWAITITYKPMGKSLALRIFIKIPVDQKNLKLGVVIAQSISKISVAIATCICMEEFYFLAPIS